MTSISHTKRMDYLGTVRGRLGWLATPTLLLFGTGGLAYGGVSSQTSITQVNNDYLFFAPGSSLNPLGFSSGSYSDTRVGWTAGAGAEWMFMPNWSAKLEYLYYDLGSVSYALGALVTTASYSSGAFAVITPQVSTHFNGHIVRAGLNYHFNWGAPVSIIAKY